MTKRSGQRDSHTADGSFDWAPVQVEFDRPPITMGAFMASAAGIFDSDEEVDDFVAFTYAARRREMA